MPCHFLSLALSISFLSLDPRHECGTAAPSRSWWSSRPSPPTSALHILHAACTPRLRDMTRCSASPSSPQAKAAIHRARVGVAERPLRVVARLTKEMRGTLVKAPSVSVSGTRNATTVLALPGCPKTKASVLSVRAALPQKSKMPPSTLQGPCIPCSAVALASSAASSLERPHHRSPGKRSSPCKGTLFDTFSFECSLKVMRARTDHSSHSHAMGPCGKALYQGTSGPLLSGFLPSRSLAKGHSITLQSASCSPCP